MDTSKGRNPQDLRFVSYDSNMLFRENPEPLLIRHFKPKEVPKKNYMYIPSLFNVKPSDAFINKLLKELNEAQPGQWMTTVQKVAYTLGSLGKPDVLQEIKGAIVNSASFTD